MQSYKALIKQLPVANHAIATKLTTWKKYNVEYPAIGNIIESLFSGRSELNLSRQDVKEIAFSQNYEKLVIATILWGYSSGMRGNNFAKILSQLDDITRLLEDAVQGVDDWQTHYARVADIKGLGLSTYSKLLYFTGGKIEGHDPLILDVRVINAINSGLYKEFDGIKKMTSSNATVLYPEYLKVANDFAKSTHCLAEQVEMFLFIFGQSLKQHRITY